MKNNRKVTNLFHLVTGLIRDRRSSMKSSNRILFPALLSLLMLSIVVTSHAQRKTTTYPTPTYTPPAPQYHPPTQTPRPAQPQYQAPAQSSPQRRTESAPQRQPLPVQTRPQQAPQEQARQQKAQQKQQQAQQRDQARQQAQQQKQEQKQQKDRARQQKELLKQQQKQQRDQAHQQKEKQKQEQTQQKEQQKQQKDQDRQQKEQQKQQKSEKNTASSPDSSAKNSAPRSSSPSAAKEPPISGSAGKRPTGASVLTPSESQATIQRLNSARSNMSGINHRPLPSGELTLHSNGRITVKAEGGRQYGVRPNGTIASYSDRERAVSFDKRGKISSIHTANLDIYHGTHGQRTIISRQADSSKVMSNGPHSGYVERNVVVNNKTYIQRTLIVNQRAYTNAFVTTNHGGIALTNFVPPVYFAPRFYGWAYYPWAAPISFGWGWFGAPWYMGPNPYFVASPIYPSAAFWLTDYMIGETLATAYQLHNDASMFENDGGAAYTADADMPADENSEASSGPQETIHADVTTPINQEIKSEIAEEVKQELANDNAEASNPSQASFDVLPSALRSPNHVFVVSSDLDVTTTDDQICGLQAGDILQLPAPAESDSSLVQLRVAGSKRMDCPVGILVSVSMPDLQGMQNNFQTQVESGLGLLRNEQGRGGLPAAPPDAIAAPPRPAIEGLAPFSAADSSAMLDQQRHEADQIEAGTEKSDF